jgi:hypothetical protein
VSAEILRIKAYQPERFANAPKSLLETIGAFARVASAIPWKYWQVLGQTRRKKRAALKIDPQAAEEIWLCPRRAMWESGWGGEEGGVTELAAKQGRSGVDLDRLAKRCYRDNKVRQSAAKMVFATYVILVLMAAPSRWSDDPTLDVEKRKERVTDWELTILRRFCGLNKALALMK